jgi:hypothetical protein
MVFSLEKEQAAAAEPFFRDGVKAELNSLYNKNQHIRRTSPSWLGVVSEKFYLCC